MDKSKRAREKASMALERLFQASNDPVALATMCIAKACQLSALGGVSFADFVVAIRPIYEHGERLARELAEAQKEAEKLKEELREMERARKESP